jgi:hypothetical protein
MGFLKPKVATPPPAPKPANPAMDPLDAEALLGDSGVYSSARSLISTSSRGLRRRASTQRTSLIGG